MTSVASSGPAASEKALVWFPDTSALVSMAVHLPLHQTVQATLSAHRRVLVTAVVAELEELAKSSTRTAAWAGAALGQLDWLGEPVRLDDPAGTELAAELQEQIAAGRPLKHALEHFGEAAIISLASRARTLRPLMLSDDYDARVAAKNRDVEPLSVHKLMHLMISQGKVTAAQAFSFADALNTAGRAQDYTADELASGRLGRVGQP
jgi:rRNA-processing protein FCF1